MEKLYPHVYISQDSDGFLDLVGKISAAKGPTKCLAAVAPLRKRTTFGDPPVLRTGCLPRLSSVSCPPSASPGFGAFV